MRIGFDVSQTCTERAGCAWYADSLVRAMVEVAPENEYFLYHQFGNWINDDTSRGTFLEHPSVKMPFRGMPAQKAREMWRDRGGELLPAGDPEIVQSNSFQVIPKGRAKLVFVVYDVSFWVCPEFTTEGNRLNCQYGVLEALKQADGFLFISESAKKEFETVLPGWLARTAKPSAAIALAARSQPINAQEAKERFWLAVGSIEPRKNYDALFSAIKLYRQHSLDPSPVWIAAPTGWKNDELKKRASELEARGWIRMLGYVNEETLGALYQQAFGFVFPSWYEGFGLPVLEAMQSGCPVICSNRTSLPEVGGEAPLYIDPSQPESICDAMIALEQDSARRRRCCEVGLNRATDFSWPRTAAATLDFYARVLQS